MLPIISIVGKKKTGKTTLIINLIKELKKRGYKTAVLKHDVHGFEIDYEGKDTYKFREAGAKKVAISYKKLFAYIETLEEEIPVSIIIEKFLKENTDLIILEGFKQEKYPKIEILRDSNTEPMTSPENGLIAIVSEEKIEKPGIKWFNPTNIEGIANLIEERIIKRNKSKKIVLEVDGKNIYLKPFVEDIMFRVIKGMIETLKGCDNFKEASIKIYISN